MMDKIGYQPLPMSKPVDISNFDNKFSAVMRWTWGILCIVSPFISGFFGFMNEALIIGVLGPFIWAFVCGIFYFIVILNVLIITGIKDTINEKRNIKQQEYNNFIDICRGK